MAKDAAVTSICARPFARIPLVRRQQILTLLVAICAVAFPLVHDNDADIDSTANVAAYDNAEHGRGCSADGWLSGRVVGVAAGPAR